MVCAVTIFAQLRSWPARRWLVAAATAVATVLIIGIPTVLIPNPVFGRDVPVTWWAWPALIGTAVLAGLVTATYVRAPAEPEKRDRPAGASMIGGVLGFFAVGCPVCNKIVLLALGTSGALQFFEPVQPLLALGSIGLLGWALVTRLRRSCAIQAPAGIPAGTPPGRREDATL